MITIARTDRSILGQWWWTVDRWTLGALMSLCAFGVFMVAAASPPVAERLGYSSFYFLTRHLVFLLPAMALMIWISMLPPKMVRRIAAIVLVGAVVLTAATFVMGVEIKGAKRWIHLLGFSLQPSEFIKPAFAVTAAWLISMQQEKPGFPGYKITALLYAGIASILILQPDFGMTFVVSVILGAQIFLAGIPLAIIVLLVVAGAGGVVGAYLFLPHVTSRIDRFLDPDSGDNYQVQKSLEAFGNGGLFGTGPAHGQVKLNLPDAHADFIFAVAGEELGLFAALVVTGIFLFIILRGLTRMQGSSDMFTVLAVSGLLTQFGVQTFIHMGSSLRLLPAKGMTLPFVSYGGSSLLSLALAMGMVLALTRRAPRNPYLERGKPHHD